MQTKSKKRTICFEKMHLVDLPAEICPGGVELRPLDATSSRLVVCSICRGHSANAFLASCGHSFCSHCATLRPNEPADDAAATRTRFCQIWCHPCRERKEAERIQVTLILDNMRFACTCGFEGKLREIKTHFWRSSEEGGHREGVEETEHEVEDVQGTDKNGVAIEQLREQNEKITAELQELRLKLNTRPEAQPGGKQYISIHIKELIEQHREKREEVWSPLYRWWGDGYPCATQVHLDVVKNSSWLGVYHQTYLEAATQPWPMKKRIRFELLNSKGGVVKTYEAPLFVNGKSISKCFAAPLKDGGYGLSKVIKVDKLQQLGDIVTEDGILSLTVEAVSL